jgi:hypothetical protein
MTRDKLGRGACTALGSAVKRSWLCFSGTSLPVGFGRALPSSSPTSRKEIRTVSKRKYGRAVWSSGRQRRGPRRRRLGPRGLRGGLGRGCRPGQGRSERVVTTRVRVRRLVKWCHEGLMCTFPRACVRLAP